MKPNKPSKNLLTYLLTFNLYSQVTHWEKARLSNANYYEVVEHFDSLYEAQNATNSALASPGGSTSAASSSSNKKYDRWKTKWSTKVDKDGNFDTQYEEYENLASGFIPFPCVDQRSLEIDWKAVGPFNSDGSCPNNCSNFCVSGKEQNQGRIDPIAPHPTNDNLILCGTRSGGIFKTSDGGQNWHNVTDAQNFSPYGVSEIKWHPSGTIVYAATGHASGGPGIGIILSTDYGNTWQRTNIQYDSNNDPSINQIVDLVIHPSSTTTRTIAYALTYGNSGSDLLMLDGSYNGNWNQIDHFDRIWNCGIRHDGGYGNLEINNGDNNEMLLWTEGGFKKYTKLFSSPVGSVPSSLDLPQITSFPNFLEIGDLDFLRLSTTNNGEVFAMALFNNVPNVNDPQFCYNGIGVHTMLFELVNSHSGLNWILLNVNADPDLFRSNLFKVDPDNSNNMYTCTGTCMFKSTDRGMTFSAMGNSGMHVDPRYFTIKQSSINSNQNILYFGNDGGIGKCTDGHNWIDINGEGLNIAQYYGMGLSEAEPNTVLLGAQDGSINLYKNDEWVETYVGGDNFDAMIDPRNNGIYHEQANYTYRRIDNYGLGAQTAFYGPHGSSFTGFSFEMDPNNPDRLMAGWPKLYENTSNGDNGSWQEIVEATEPSYYTETGIEISSIVICPSNSDVTYYSRKGANYGDNIDG